MRKLSSLLLLLGVGCSTAPIADLLDYTSPGRTVPDPYQRGDHGPKPPPIPPVPFDRSREADLDQPPIRPPNRPLEREPPRPIERESDQPPIGPPPPID